MTRPPRRLADLATLAARIHRRRRAAHQPCNENK
jgi:hypothetical protein